MNDSAELLRELRIDRRDPPAARRPPLPWILGSLLVLLLIAGGWWLLGRGAGIEVRTASARAISASAAGPASVLDASGYVTARRQATVSAKITGKVTEVLIEEGMRVEEGQVLARLDPIDVEAQRTLSNSQLLAARSQLDEARTQLALAEKTLRGSTNWLARKLIAQSALRPGPDRARRTGARSSPPRSATCRWRRTRCSWPRSASTTPWCARRLPAWSR
jgi:multidrug efflux pump subunit AcrA (membrane-fusion protein)